MGYRASVEGWPGAGRRRPGAARLAPHLELAAEVGRAGQVGQPAARDPAGRGSPAPGDPRSCPRWRGRRPRPGAGINDVPNRAGVWPAGVRAGRLKAAQWGGDAALGLGPAGAEAELGVPATTGEVGQPWCWRSSCYLSWRRGERRRGPASWKHGVQQRLLADDPQLSVRHRPLAACVVPASTWSRSWLGDWVCNSVPGPRVGERAWRAGLRRDRPLWIHTARSKISHKVS